MDNSRLYISMDDFFRDFYDQGYDTLIRKEETFKLRTICGIKYYYIKSFSFYFGIMKEIVDILREPGKKKISKRIITACDRITPAMIEKCKKKGVTLDANGTYVAQGRKSQGIIR